MHSGFYFHYAILKRRVKKFQHYFRKTGLMQYWWYFLGEYLSISVLSWPFQIRGRWPPRTKCEFDLNSSLSNGYCTALPFIYSSTKMKKMRCSQDDISIGSYLGTFSSPLSGPFWTSGTGHRATFHRKVSRDDIKMKKVFILFSLGLFFGTTFSFAVKYLVVHIWCCEFFNMLRNPIRKDLSPWPIRTLDWKHQFVCYNIG